MESIADLAKKKEKIQHELQSKQQYIASLEGQLQHAKQAAEAEISKVFNYYILFNPFAAEVTFVQCTKKAKHKKNHLNPVMLVFIGKLSLRTFNYFSAFLSSSLVDQISNQQLKG